MFFTKQAFAQSISADKFGVDKGFGQIKSYYNLISFIFNFLYYIGYAAAIIGIIYTLAFIAYKLWFNDEKETYEIFNGGMTKIVLIALSALLLINAGFLMTLIASIFGINNLKLITPPSLKY